jgi:hypothetical protein
MEVREIHATATEKGSCAFARWGFTFRSSGLGGGRLAARNALAARAAPADSPNPGPVPAPADLVPELTRLLRAEPAHSPLVDMGAVLGPPLPRRRAVRLSTARGVRVAGVACSGSTLGPR